MSTSVSPCLLHDADDIVRVTYRRILRTLCEGQNRSERDHVAVSRDGQFYRIVVFETSVRRCEIPSGDGLRHTTAQEAGQHEA